MGNILFLGWKKPAFSELSLTANRAWTTLCFSQVSANVWVVAGRPLYRVWVIAWSRLSISKAVLEFLWLTTDIWWQHLTWDQVSKVHIFLNSFSLYLKLSQLAKYLFCSFCKFQWSNFEDQENAKSYMQTVWEWYVGSTGWLCTLLGMLTPKHVSACFPCTLSLQDGRQCWWLQIICCALFEYWPEQTWILQNIGVPYPFLLPALPQKLTVLLIMEEKLRTDKLGFPYSKL